MDNTQAFPATDEGKMTSTYHPGMLLIDYMAAKVLQGMMANPNKAGNWSDRAAESYKIAAAMLVEREKYIK